MVDVLVRRLMGGDLALVCECVVLRMQVIWYCGSGHRGPGDPNKQEMIGETSD